MHPTKKLMSSRELFSTAADLNLHTNSLSLRSESFSKRSVIFLDTSSRIRSGVRSICRVITNCCSVSAELYLSVGAFNQASRQLASQDLSRERLEFESPNQ